MPSANTSSLNIGREFVVSGGGISVGFLGVYDDNGTSGLINSHDVTLFSISNIGAPSSETPITGGSVNIPSGTSALLDGGFRLEPLAAPIFLPAGDYAVIAYGLDTGVNGNGDHYGDGGGVLASANANNAGFDPYQFTTLGTPNFPTGGDGNNHSGATFYFATPEPASYVLFVVGAGSV